MRAVRGVVLAGGRGRRLGLGVPKARAGIAGRTLLERAVATLAEACGEVIVVAPAGLDLGPCAARRVCDVAGFAGPLAGLVAGLEACAGADVAVLGVDFPLAGAGWPRALLERLAADASHGAAVARAVVPRPGGFAQPLVAAYGAGAAAELRVALECGVTSLRGGLEKLAVTWLEDADLAVLPGGATALLNVNTPADLDAARRLLEPVTGGVR